MINVVRFIVVSFHHHYITACRSVCVCTSACTYIFVCFRRVLFVVGVGIVSSKLTNISVIFCELFVLLVMRFLIGHLALLLHVFPCAISLYRYIVYYTWRDS